MTNSVIVIAHDRLEDLTIPCVETLAAHTLAPHELICVDDGSSDGTLDYFRGVADVALRLRRRSGPAPARNAGMRAATGDNVVFLDNDSFMPAGWLGALVAEMGKYRIGIVAGIPSDELWRLSVPRSLDGLIDANNVGTGCMGVTRSVFDRLGYLDTGRGLCGSDTDYCYRAWLAGFRVANTPRVVYRHLGGGTRKRMNQERIDRDRARFWQKWGHLKHLFPIRYPEVR